MLIWENNNFGCIADNSRVLPVCKVLTELLHLLAEQAGVRGVP